MIAERVVFDTNVLISAALLPQGPPRAALDALRAASGVLLFSDETFEEMHTRILRRFRASRSCVRRNSEPGSNRHAWGSGQLHSMSAERVVFDTSDRRRSL